MQPVDIRLTAACGFADTFGDKMLQGLYWDYRLFLDWLPLTVIFLGFLGSDGRWITTALLYLAALLKLALTVFMADMLSVLA